RSRCQYGNLARDRIGNDFVSPFRVVRRESHVGIDFIKRPGLEGIISVNDWHGVTLGHLAYHPCFINTGTSTTAFEQKARILNQDSFFERKSRQTLHGKLENLVICCCLWVDEVPATGFVKESGYIRPEK